MTPRELAQEIAYPLRQPTLAVALLAFVLLVKLVLAAGLFGLWLAVVVLPAMLRFLLGVCEARIYDTALETPGIEKFNWLASPWSLMAMLWVLASAWLLIEVQLSVGMPLTAVAGAAVLAVLPAPLAMLALTRSPLASVNPLALTALVRACGWRYAAIPAVMVGGVLLLYVSYALGVPNLVMDVFNLYLVFLLFTLTGAVVAKSEARRLVSDPVAEEPEPEQTLERLDQARVATLNHAYGLISRGNRAGGLAHIQAFIAQSDFVLEDYAWFFDSMLSWEQTDPALFFAQTYLHALLEHGEFTTVLKVLGRCGLENPRFRPLPEDRERLRALVDAHHRADLRKLLD